MVALMIPPALPAPSPTGNRFGVPRAQQLRVARDPIGPELRGFDPDQQPGSPRSRAARLKRTSVRCGGRRAPGPAGAGRCARASRLEAIAERPGSGLAPGQERRAGGRSGRPEPKARRSSCLLQLDASERARPEPAGPSWSRRPRWPTARVSRELLGAARASKARRDETLPRSAAGYGRSRPAARSGSRLSAQTPDRGARSAVAVARRGVTSVTCGLIRTPSWGVASAEPCEERARCLARCVRGEDQGLAGELAGCGLERGHRPESVRNRSTRVPVKDHARRLSWRAAGAGSCASGRCRRVRGRRTGCPRGAPQPPAPRRIDLEFVLDSCTASIRVSPGTALAEQQVAQLGVRAGRPRGRGRARAAARPARPGRRRRRSASTSAANRPAGPAPKPPRGGRGATGAPARAPAGPARARHDAPARSARE
jgi:hypothetical protein